jgi:hypothetical protein
MEITMSTNHLKSLQLTAAPARGDRVLESRARLIRRLMEQAHLAENPDYMRTERRRVDDGTGTKRTVDTQKRVAPWFKTDGAGVTTLTVKVGFRNLEFAPGKSAIVVPEGKMEQVIGTIVSAVRNGELDDALAKAAQTGVGQKARAKKRAA